MANRHLSILYNERKLGALLHELEIQDKDISDELSPAVDALYEKLVPPEKKEEVAAMIENDMEEEAKRSVIHFSSSDDDYFFIPEAPLNFHSVIQIYCEGLREDANRCTLDSLAEYFNDRQEIDEFAFSILRNAMPNDHRLAAVYTFNFDDNTIAITDHHGDVTRTYCLDDVYEAYTDAVADSDGRYFGWNNCFDSYMEGKEIDFEDETENITMQM